MLQLKSINQPIANASCYLFSNKCLAEKRMTLTHKQKEQVTDGVKRHDKDTGSPEYQIALFTEKIKKLTAHLKKNAKDFHSRRGLLKMISKRKRLMLYLEKVNEKSYKAVIKKLGLKG
jgi:small subunit ribosomal protein S15